MEPPVGKRFGVVYDTTFNAIIDPFDVRFGHATFPRVPHPFTPLAQMHSTGLGCSWSTLALGVVAVGVVGFLMYNKQQKK